ncbi:MULTISPECIES: EamA family transporter [unclassified Treponema]|uniref:EamA family transporter n=1 Tax=unclassified Treponema TaxID=2638727 RepID=UPI0025CD9139|nr:MULTISPECIES: EamA family transporter [unclassified Treponema]
MLSYVLPVVLVVLSNVMYQICAKSVPNGINPLASLTITYSVGAVFSAVMYFVLNRNGNLFQEYGRLNWVPFVFGIVLVGLEVGWIYIYKAGWPVSTASVVQSAFLAVALIFVGWLFYKEHLSWNKIAGVFVVLAGLALINR